MKRIMIAVMSTILFCTTVTAQKEKNLLPEDLKGSALMFSDQESGKSVILEQLTKIKDENKMPVLVVTMKQTKEAIPCQLKMGRHTDVETCTEYGLCFTNVLTDETFYLKFFSKEQEERFIHLIEKFYGLPIESMSEHQKC